MIFFLAVLAFERWFDPTIWYLFACLSIFFMVVLQTETEEDRLLDPPVKEVCPYCNLDMEYLRFWNLWRCYVCHQRFDPPG